MVVPLRIPLLILTISAGLLVPGPATAQESPDAPPAIQDRIAGHLSANVFSDAMLGAAVVNLETGATIYQNNPNTNFVPASNLKLYTAAAGLHLLGPQFRYETRVYVRDSVRNGALLGPLVVRGSGDPSIGGRFRGGDRTYTFRQWADSLRAAGIRSIEGPIVGDDRVFDEVPYGTGWSWDDLTYWYAAPVSGLTFNENCVDVLIRSTQPGQRGLVSWLPFGTDYVTVTNETVTISADRSLDEGYARKPGTNHIVLDSKVPANSYDPESITIHQPTKYFVHILAETLRRQGIQVLGKTLDIENYTGSVDYNTPEWRRIAHHSSPPLRELVKVINIKSHNLYAEQLLKTIGVEVPPEDTTLTPGSFEAGIATMRRTLHDLRVDTSRISLVDGSGLSRQNLVTPRTTVQLLEAMWNHPDPAVKRAFYESIPDPGAGGTLGYRLMDHQEQIRAKTGFLSHIRSLSGYATSRDGVPYAFALFCNHYTAKKRQIDDAFDDVVRVLATQ